MKIIQSVIRYILCMTLLYGVYTETGVWTTASLLLIFISAEGIAYLLKKIRIETEKALKEIEKLFMED